MRVFPPPKDCGLSGVSQITGYMTACQVYVKAPPRAKAGNAAIVIPGYLIVDRPRLSVSDSGPRRYYGDLGKEEASPLDPWFNEFVASLASATV